MSLSLSLLGRKCWPYAKNGPWDSVGEYRGILYPAKLGGGIHCWVAKGNALLLFKESIKPKILDFLAKNSDKVHDSSDYLCIPIFMVGKRQEKSKPVVFFVSDDEAARKEAFEMVKRSKILDDYPGVELGHSDMGRMMALAGKGDTVLGRYRLSQDGTPVLRLLPESAEAQGPGVSAVGGGVLECQGQFYILTANHFLEQNPPQELNLPAPGAEKGKANETSSCEITGLSDFDDESDDDDDDAGFGSVDYTSQGSFSEPSHSERGSVMSNVTMVPSKESVASLMDICDDTEENEPTVQEDDHASGRECLPVGTVLSFSRELEYALIEVSEREWHRLPNRMLSESLSCSNKHAFATAPRVSRVWTTTSSKGRIDGILSEDFHHIRFPHCKEFTRVFVANFAGQLTPGDCGCWVRDVGTGQLYGHIVAGSVDGGQVLIVPIISVLEHAGLTKRIVLTEADILKMTADEFQQYSSSEQVLGLGALGQHTPYVPLTGIQKYWKRPHALKALEIVAKMCHQKTEIILQDYIRILSILLYIGHPQLLAQFVSAGQADINLPYKCADSVPLSHDGYGKNKRRSRADDFFDQQWLFSPVTFSEQVLSGSKLGPWEVLPVGTERLEGKSFRAGDVVSDYVKIRGDYGSFASPGMPSTTRALFRRYPPEKSRPAAEKVFSVQRAVAEFAPSTEQLQFKLYGSFFHDLALITVLPYPEAGTLAELIKKEGKPTTLHQLTSLWSGLRDCLRGLENFLVAREKGLNSGSYHLEITPAKIIVFPGPTGLEFDLKLKLDILDLAEIDHKLGPTDEIWGLGSVFSEVLVWTTMGARGVKDYKLQRKKEDQNHEALFRHALSKRLSCVGEFHEAAQKNRSRWDELTPRISRLILGRMFQVLPGENYPASKLLDRFLFVISDAAKSVAAKSEAAKSEAGQGTKQTRGKLLDTPGDQAHPSSSFNILSYSSAKRKPPPSATLPGSRSGHERAQRRKLGSPIPDARDPHERHQPPESGDHGVAKLAVDTPPKSVEPKRNDAPDTSAPGENTGQLDGPEHIFVIDDYGSMTDYSEEVKSVLGALAAFIRSSRSGGVVLHFASQSSAHSPVELRPEHPTFLEDIARRVEYRLLKQRDGLYDVDNVFRRLRDFLAHKGDIKNPVNIYVLTTGITSGMSLNPLAATSAVHGSNTNDSETYRIFTDIRERCRRGLFFQFIRFGNHPIAMTNLTKLASGLADRPGRFVKVSTASDKIEDILNWSPGNRG